MAAPVIGAASSLHRNAITRAIAWGSTALAIRSGGYDSRLAGVSMSAGSTALTRTPSDLSSSARTSVSFTTPALATAYPAEPDPPMSAVRAETFTMEPAPAACIRRAAARHDHHAVA